MAMKAIEYKQPAWLDTALRGWSSSLTCLAVIHANIDYEGGRRSDVLAFLAAARLGARASRGIIT